MSSSKQQIARAAGIVIVAFALSRVLGLAREMIIGRQFGTSGELDAYLAAFRLPDILFQLVAGGALGSAFIPTFSGYLARGDEQGAWRLASAVINLVLLLLSALALLAAVFAPLLVAEVVAPGFDPAKRALTVQLMRPMLLSPIIFGVSGIVMGILNSYQHFLLPASAPIVYNLSIIGAALALSPSLGIRSLAVGVVVGSLLHLAVQVPGLVKKGSHYFPILGLREPGVREVGRLMAPRVLGLAVVQLNFLVNTILASGLADGSLAALNFAWLLMLLPQGIFAQALATAAFPTFSELAAKRQVAEMRSTLSATLRAILYLAIPASVGLFALRYPIVQLLFQRGAFKEGSTEAVVWALQFYALGLFAHAVVEIVTRAFYALHDTLTPVLVGVGAMSINVVLSLILIGPLAHGGLALANSTATILEMAGLLLVIRRRLEGLEGDRLLSFTLRTVLAAGLMGFGVSWFATGRHEPSIIVGGGGIALGGLIYFAASLALGSGEVRALWQMALRR